MLDIIERSLIGHAVDIEFPGGNDESMARQELVAAARIKQRRNVESGRKCTQAKIEKGLNQLIEAFYILVGRE